MKKTIPVLLFVLMLVFLFSGCQSMNKSMRVNDLRCEYIGNPLGIDSTTPRLSWKLAAGGYNRSQSAYHILAASSPDLLSEGSADLWDSGKVDSDQSVNIPWGGKELNSRQQVFWKVQVWDEQGAESKWSETAKWEMALLNAEEWQAKWVGVEESKEPAEMKTGPAPWFRKEFTINKSVKQARVYVTGLGYYELFLNGSKTGNDELVPAQTNYEKRDLTKLIYDYDDQSTTRVLYNIYDVTSQLVQGKNAAGIVLGNGWYNQRDRVSEGRMWFNTPRFFLQLEIEYKDGERQTLVGDRSWQYTTEGPIRHDGLFTGEHYDARMEMPGWSTADFDASGWQQANLLKAPDGKLYPQLAPRDGIIDTIKPVSVKHTKDNVYVYDFGLMFSGWVKLNINGNRGDTLHLRFIEELGSDYNQADQYICKGGSESWEPSFTWHAFRTVEIRGSSVPLDLNSISGRVVNTVMDTVGYFNCSNELFNKIHDNYIRTQLGNMHGSFSSDCPHRERLGYTGDGSLLVESSIFNFDMTRFYDKWVNDIDDARNKKTGFVPHTAPYEGGGGGPAWGSAYVIVPWFYYVYYGDTQILQQHYEGMKQWVDYLGTRTDKEGIVVREEPNGWCLGDWVTPEAIELPEPLVNTGYYYYCAKLVAQIADVLDKPKDRDHYSALLDEIQSAMDKRYYNEKNQQYWTSYQGADVFPLAFGMVKNENIDGVFDSMVENIVKNREHLDTGILGTPLVLEVLTDMGREDLAFMMMNQRDFPSFGNYILGKGVTTLWEEFSGKSSHSHPMFGSVIRWFYKGLGGINPDTANPGFKHIIIKPILCGDLTFVNTQTESFYGLIKSNWKLDKNGNLKMDVEIPVNTTATVYVPATSEELVSVNSEVAQFVRIEDNKAVYKVGSGVYTFKSQGAAKLMKPVHLPTPIITNVDTLYFKPNTANIEISASNNADIYYTLDGSIPDGNSIKYTGPLEIKDNTIIRAVAIKDGFINSYDRADKVRFIDPAVNGIAYTVYEGEWSDLGPDPESDKYKVASTGKTFEFDVNKIERRGDYVAIRFEGSFDIKTPGKYTFYANANDGCVLKIDGKTVVYDAGAYAARKEFDEIDLKAGRHDLDLFYYEVTGSESMDFNFKGPGFEKQMFPPEWMTIPGDGK